MNSYLILRSSIQGEEDEDTRLLQEMAATAEDFIRSEPWCLQLTRGRFVAGVGGIVALFLFEARIAKVPASEWVWVIVGDIPSSYLSFKGFESPYDALERYIKGLEEWADAVTAGQPLELLIPLRAEPSCENAESLRPRCRSIRELVVPWLSKQPVMLPEPERPN